MNNETPRTAADLEAQREQLRADLADTVNELSDRLDPRAQLETAKEQAKETWDQTSRKARELGEDALFGDTRALAIVGGAALGVLGVTVLLIRRLTR